MCVCVCVFYKEIYIKLFNYLIRLLKYILRYKTQMGKNLKFCCFILQDIILR